MVSRIKLLVYIEVGEAGGRGWQIYKPRQVLKSYSSQHCEVRRLALNSMW